MMEESTPRKSASWKPHSTFAGEMGIANRGLSISAVGSGSGVEKSQHEAQATQV